MPSRRRSFATTERRYPRTARLNELLREVLAEELERLADHDERLTLITVTGVEIEADLRHAKVLFSSLAGEASEALEAPLTEKEEKTLKDLNTFDFGDL